MPSAFPGMDPYLERPGVWEDFHGDFIYSLRETLLRVMPQNYDARVGQQVYLVQPPPETFVEVQERYIEVLHEPDQSLVAVVELLSPANKEQPGHGDYLSKRERLLQQDIHLIEIDLLRAGRRLPMKGDMPSGQHFIYLARAEERPVIQVYGWPLHQSLPAIPFPLRAPDSDIWINLQAVFALAFNRGGFQRRIHYDQPPPGPLSDADRTWVQERVQARAG
jgi:hypothetical protein